jgi:Carboxypeptidase regulatory-like domain/TonB dependent receptor/TonB-dependent Receptor Plug Domain
MNSRALRIALRCAVITALLCFVCVVLAFSQQSAGTILGTVVDSQNARIPGVNMVITNSGTGIATTVKTDSSGLYSAPSLPIGTYSVTASKDGFETVTQSPITLTVGRSAVVDITLPVGQVSSQVQVEADAPVVETSSSSVSYLIGEKEVRDLPLNGRNLMQLTLLAPGVQPVPQENTEGASTIVPFGFGSPQRFSIAGGRPQGQLYLIDSTDTAGVWGNGTGANLVGTTLGVDAIAEFEVLTNTYSAVYGGNGAVVNAALRSGTNNLHGSAYEFLRNSALDARNYFDPLTGALPFKRNQFGATLGGPIRKDKTFFFVNYEGLRQELTVPVITTVPDANFRNGFLPCAQAVGFPCNPTTGLANVGVNPNIAGYLNTYPAPNGISLGNGTAQNVSDLNHPVSENFGVVKLDQTLGSKDLLTASYLIDDASLTAHPQPVLTDNDTQRNQYFTIEERRTISSTMVNVAHFSIVQSNIKVLTQNVPSLALYDGSQYPGTIGVVGLSTIGGNDDAKELLTRFTWRDQLTFSKGRHTFTAGFEAARRYIDANIPIINGGSVVYNPLGPLSSFAAFLTNTPLAFAGVPLDASNSHRDLRYWTFFPYIQDKWQVSPRLTLNLGLRYDYETNPVEKYDNLYTLTNPLINTGFTHVPNAFASNPTTHNVNPRVGFAWDVFGDGKTSLRGGFGIFADLPLDMQVTISYLFNPPIYDVQTILFPTIPNPFSGGGMTVGLPGSAQLTDYNTNRNPYIMEYNLNIQHQLTNNTILTLGYLGSRANHLYIGQETNACLATSTLPDGTIVRNYVSTATCPTVNPALGNVVDRFPVGTSNYSSLQVAVERSFASNFQFRSAYTWSKCLDYGSYYTGNDSIGPNGQTFGLQTGNLANINYNIDHGPCDYDLRSNFTNNLVYQLPFHGNRLKDGWQLSTIVSLHSGTPFSVFDGIDQANVGQAGAAANGERPNRVTGASDTSGGIRFTSLGVVGYNASAFQLQPSGVFGDLTRNTLTSPGVFEWDLALSKVVKISERMGLQLRAEAFNLTNHTNFGFPNAQLYTGVNPDGTGVANPSAGLITTTATTSRQLQFSAKFTF